MCERFYPGGKRSSGGGLLSAYRQAGPGGLAAPGRGAWRAAGRPPSGILVSGAVGGRRELRREFGQGSPAAHHSPGPLSSQQTPAYRPPTATMVSKSDQLLIVVSILEGELPGTWRLQLLLVKC